MRRNKKAIKIPEQSRRIWRICPATRIKPHKKNRYSKAERKNNHQTNVCED